MYEVWIWDGGYIQGKKLRGKAKTVEAGLKKAAKKLKDVGVALPLQSEEGEGGEVWIDDDELRPVGILIPTK